MPVLGDYPSIHYLIAELCSRHKIRFHDFNKSFSSSPHLHCEYVQHKIQQKQLLQLIERCINISWCNKMPRVEPSQSDIIRTCLEDFGIHSLIEITRQTTYPRKRHKTSPRMLFCDAFLCGFRVVINLFTRVMKKRFPLKAGSLFKVGREKPEKWKD